MENYQRMPVILVTVVVRTRTSINKCDLGFDFFIIIIIKDRPSRDCTQEEGKVEVESSSN